MIHSAIGGHATSIMTATRDETRPIRNEIAVAVHKLLRVGYMPWKNIAKEDTMNAMVPRRIAILKGTVGVPRMSIIPKTVRLRAASMPGKHALTIGFINRSSASDDIASRWLSWVYILFSTRSVPSIEWAKLAPDHVPLSQPEIPISLTVTSTGFGSDDL